VVTGFCGSCGAALGPQASFCGSCGASVRPEPAAYTNAAPRPSPVTPSGGASGLKIVVGLLFVMGAASVMGMYYAAHRYIKLAEDVTGVKADDVLYSVRHAADHGNHSGHADKRDGCLLLSKAEASAILGIEVERVDGKLNEHASDEHCDFFVKPGSIAENEEKIKQSAEAARREPVKEEEPLPAASVDMLKSLARGAVEAARNGEAPYFSYTVERENGRIAFTAFGLTDRLSYADMSTASGKSAEPIGVGDRAAIAGGESRMCIVKGNAALTLDLTQVSGGKAKGIALAKTILPRL
jgi:hypothetical protein